MYRTFMRTWWRRNPAWPGGREPHAGRKSYAGNYSTEAEARAACIAHNEANDPGFLSRKMEYERS